MTLVGPFQIPDIHNKHRIHVHTLCCQTSLNLCEGELVM